MSSESVRMPLGGLHPSTNAAARADRKREPGDGVDEVRILVVDDTGANRALVRALLGPLDIAIEEARNGEEAVALTESAHFDLILMDVHMPRLDGPGAVRAIRSGGGPCRMTPIIALSADVTSQTASSFIAAGMDDAVAKPIAAGELIEKVAAWLSKAGQGEPCAKTGSNG